MVKSVSCGFSEWTALCHCGLIKLHAHQALLFLCMVVVASHTGGGEGVRWSQSLAFPQRCAVVVAELKDSGALFSVPIISKKCKQMEQGHNIFC